MRTTLDIDDNLMESLIRLCPDSSKTEAVERAVEDFVYKKAAERLISLQGKVEIEDVSRELRELDRI